MDSRYNKVFLLACCAVYLIPNLLFAQVEEQTTGEAKKSESGYDFYDIKTKQKTGSSRKIREDIYYYDKHGNLVGKARKDRNNKRAYNYYNADGVRVGTLKKKTDGSYSYMNDQSGKITQTMPLKRGDVISLSPESLRGEQK
ncbi:MAG: hypothetical protein PHT53_00935 [Candidatus Omnitrophica bacterium]|nr:hypothetical protein [Candidatus Omnitrophota bacterium]